MASSRPPVEMLTHSRHRLQQAVRPLALGINHDNVENPDDAASKLFIGNDEINWNAASGQDDQIREVVEPDRPILSSAVSNTGGVKEETKKVIREATQRAEAAKQSGEAMVKNAQKVIGSEIDKIR